MAAHTLVSKRKASYDLTFKLKAVKCAEEKTKEAATRELNIDPRRPYVFVYVVASYNTLLRKVRSLACHRKTLITAQRNKFSLFNAGLD